MHLGVVLFAEEMALDQVVRFKDRLVACLAREVLGMPEMRPHSHTGTVGGKGALASANTTACDVGGYKNGSAAHLLQFGSIGWGKAHVNGCMGVETVTHGLYLEDGDPARQRNQISCSRPQA